jgi:hypothetical protein
VIIDSFKAYFSSSVNIMTFFKSLVERAQQLGKNGVGVFGDIGSIALTEMQKQKLLDQHSKELVVMNN